MPFIGKDWRSPGEAWVKTEEGSWERLKILETAKSHEPNGFHSDSSTDSDSDSDISGNEEHEVSSSGSKEKRSGQSECEPPPHSMGFPLGGTGYFPHVQITLKSTKEVAGYNTISEALYRLDFYNAIRDIRRFNYVCKLLQLLINQSLTSLSGCATRVLFSMLEQIASQVSSTQENIHVLKTLIDDLKSTMNKYYCWGRPLGSTLLWEQHLQTLEKICQVASSIQIKGPPEEETPAKRLTDLPEELIREILLRLSDYKDLVNSGGAYGVMGSLVDEQHVWRQLTKYHFTRQQVRQSSQQFTNPQGRVDWEQTFHFLRRKFGLKEEYAETLFLCRYCRCLFWKSFGHPCVIYQDAAESETECTKSDSGPVGSPDERFSSMSVPLHIPIPPQTFLKFFSL